MTYNKQNLTPIYAPDHNEYIYYLKIMEMKRIVFVEKRLYLINNF